MKNNMNKFKTKNKYVSIFLYRYSNIFLIFSIIVVSLISIFTMIILLTNSLGKAKMQVYLYTIESSSDVYCYYKEKCEDEKINFNICNVKNLNSNEKEIFCFFTNLDLVSLEKGPLVLVINNVKYFYKKYSTNISCEYDLSNYLKRTLNVVIEKPNIKRCYLFLNNINTFYSNEEIVNFCNVYNYNVYIFRYKEDESIRANEIDYEFSSILKFGIYTGVLPIYPRYYLLSFENENAYLGKMDISDKILLSKLITSIKQMEAYLDEK